VTQGVRRNPRNLMVLGANFQKKNPAQAWGRAGIWGAKKESLSVA